MYIYIINCIKFKFGNILPIPINIPFIEFKSNHNTEAKMNQENDDEKLLSTLSPPIHFTIQTIFSSILDQWYAMESIHYSRLCQKRLKGTQIQKIEQDSLNPSHTISPSNTISSSISFNSSNPVINSNHYVISNTLIDPDTSSVASTTNDSNKDSNLNENSTHSVYQDNSQMNYMTLNIQSNVEMNRNETFNRVDLIQQDSILHMSNNNKINEPYQTHSNQTFDNIDKTIFLENNNTNHVFQSSFEGSILSSNQSSLKNSFQISQQEQLDSNSKNEDILPTFQEYIQSCQGFVQALKLKIQNYIVLSLIYLQNLSKTNPRIRSKRDKMTGLAFYLQETFQEDEWDWTHRVIIDLDRFGIFDIENMSTVPAIGFSRKSTPKKSISRNFPLNGSTPKETNIINGLNNINNREEISESTPTSTQILIIGAGASGIIAAIRLRQMGYHPIILEARDRIGGRVLTINGADIGATIMTGGETSPLYHWTKGLGLRIKKISDQGKIYRSNGELLNHEFDMKIQEKFNELLDLTSKISLDEISSLIGRSLNNYYDTSLGEVLFALCDQYVNSYQNSDEKNEVMSLLQWHISNLEYGIGWDLGNVNLKGWDLDDGFETRGFHFLIHGGVQQIFTKMAELHDLDIRFGNTVTKVDYSGNTVSIHYKKDSSSMHRNPRTNDPLSIYPQNISESNEYIITADKVLITTPLSLLQNNSIQFEPPLPQEKNINSLKLGTLNKIIMFFNNYFWENPQTKERDFYFGQISDNIESRIKSAGYLIWDVSDTVGQPCLMSLVPGNSAIELSSEEENSIIRISMERIRQIFPNAPSEPQSYYITNWREDIFSQGCYTYVANGSKGIEDYDTLAKDVNRKIYFGGEHTMGMYSATVLGAALSGIREAGKIDCHFSLEKEARGDRNSGTIVYRINQLKRYMRDAFCI